MVKRSSRDFERADEMEPMAGEEIEEPDPSDIELSAECFFDVIASFTRDVVTPYKDPLRALKWIAPLGWCFCCFCFQSIMLHQATIAYVERESKTVMFDVGHEILGFKKVPMKVLDLISFSAMSTFFMGTAVLRALRLWVKVFFCCGCLFFMKGLLDYVTVLPDSSGWARCQERLGPDGVEYMLGFEGLSGMDYWSRLFRLELSGVKGHWPERYCADMILSGHTFVMLLFLLGCADLVRRVRVVLHNTFMWVVEIAVNVIIAGCVCADLYLILVNHFHYTVDVLLAIIMTLLLYTNAGVAKLVDSWVELGEDENDEDRTKADGAIWLPPILFPCCCFQGYYDLTEMKEEKVRKYVKKTFGAFHSDDDSEGDFVGSGEDEQQGLCNNI